MNTTTSSPTPRRRTHFTDQSGSLFSDEEIGQVPAEIVPDSAGVCPRAKPPKAGPRARLDPVLETDSAYQRHKKRLVALEKIRFGFDGQLAVHLRVVAYAKAEDLPYGSAAMRLIKSGLETEERRERRRRRT